MVPATKRELSSASPVVWAEWVRVCAAILRPGPEPRPERGFGLSGRMRVSAYGPSSDEPQEGHDSPSTAISDVQAGHLMGRRIVSPEKAGPGSFTSPARTKIRRAPAECFPAGALFALSFVKVVCDLT